jgi:hypothetical protein
MSSALGARGSDISRIALHKDWSFIYVSFMSENYHRKYSNEACQGINLKRSAASDTEATCFIIFRSLQQQTSKIGDETPFKISWNEFDRAT